MPKFRNKTGLVLALLSVAFQSTVPVEARARFGQPAGPTADLYLTAPPNSPTSLRVQFFGTTTLLFSDGRNAVMIDALLSRPRLASVLLGRLKSDPSQVDVALQRAGVRHVDLLLISHTHYDHVLDAPAVAKRTGALLVGSKSAREVALGAGLPAETTRLLRDGETLLAGDFRVRVFRSLHSPGDRVPGIITEPLKQPAKVRDYKEGGTYAFLVEHRGIRMLVHASANVVPGMYDGVRADVAFLAIGGLGRQQSAYVQNYWRETVERTGARLVVPIHWDDFLKPMDQPQQPMPRFMDDYGKAISQIAPLAEHGHVSIRYMPTITPIDVRASIPAERGTSRTVDAHRPSSDRSPPRPTTRSSAP